MIIGAHDTRGKIRSDRCSLAAKETGEHTSLAVLALSETSYETSTAAKRFRAKCGTEAAVLVVLAKDLRVCGTYANRAGELNDKAIEQIVVDLAKILAK